MRFVFKENKKPLFQCQLVCKQCAHINPLTKIRCRNRVCIGLDVCWLHLFYNDHLRIKPSNIAGGGKGVFALVPNLPIFKQRSKNEIIFRKNDFILEYIGEYTNQDILQNRYGDYTAPYAISTEDNETIDSACERGVASMINHASQTKSNAFFEFDELNKKVIVRATKIIRNGDEILVNYGKNYQFFEKNVSHTTKYK